MKILYTITSYLPAMGGAQQHFHEIALRLQATEELQVIRQWDRNRQDWLLGSTVFAPHVQAAMIDGIDTRGLNFSLLDRALMAPGIPLFYGAPQVFTPWVSRFFLKRLRESKFKPDLIHHGRVGRENLAWASFLWARELGVPAVLTPFHHPRWVGWRYREWLKLYRQADHVFALTEAEKKILQTLGVASDRITVIGHGPTVLPTADGAGFRKKHGLGSHPVVLFLGQKYLYKGFVQLLDSAAGIWKQFPETRFVFVGPRTQESVKIFGERPQDARIIEVDAVSLQEKCDALAACDIFAMVSNQESFGGVYVEAWMYSKPVVGGRIPAISDVVEDGVNGLLVEQDSAAIAAAILTFLRDPEKAAAFGRAGLDKARREFAWEAITARVRDAYGAIIERHRRELHLRGRSVEQNSGTSH